MAPRASEAEIDSREGRKSYGGRYYPSERSFLSLLTGGVSGTMCSRSWRFHSRQTCYFHKRVDPEWTLSFCFMGPTEFELIEPASGPTVLRDFIAARGGGLHHIGFEVKDIDARLAQARRPGIGTMQSQRCASAHSACLDTVGQGGMLVEIIQREERWGD